MQSKVDVADKLTTVFKLQSELEATREKAAVREAELNEEVQQARRDRKEMEAKLAGLDLSQMQVALANCCMSAAIGSSEYCVPFDLDCHHS